MIFSLRKVWARMKFIILFLIMTFLIYHFLNLISGWIVPQYRYEQPSGRAIKAFELVDRAEEGLTFGDRLRLFYWYGE
ncbi:MAG: DUF4227 family protein [Paenibacillaceae bacterium]